MRDENLVPRMDEPRAIKVTLKARRFSKSLSQKNWSVSAERSQLVGMSLLKDVAWYT